MPFYKEISFSDTTKVFLWKITEDYNELFRSVSLKDSSLFRLEKMKSESHQKGFLAVRMLLQHLGYTDFDLEYDETGKPHLKIEDGRWEMGDGNKIMMNINLSSLTLNSQLPASSFPHISISHSGEFSAIAISDEKIGIDLEKVKDKVLKIAPRFMDISHLEGLSIEDKIRKSTVIWGIKESIFKIKNKVGISFPDHIFENEFSLNDKKCLAKLHFDNEVELFNAKFDFVEDYTLVICY
ncbi:MAG: hypothetical protein QM535_11930 [Limnohabitans sp.]|nr:hypothetical protein [Limnohabitans sp.]